MNVPFTYQFACPFAPKNVTFVEHNAGPMFGRKYRGIPASGNCLFAAFGYVLQRDHSQLRNVAVDHVRAHWNSTVPGFDIEYRTLPVSRAGLAYPDAGSYPQELRKDKEYASQAEICALSDLFQVLVVIKVPGKENFVRFRTGLLYNRQLY